MKFSYMKLRGRDLPVIPLRIRGKEEWVGYNAFVDSGAGFSVFGSEVAEDLGLKLEDEGKKYVTVGDGSLMAVYLKELEIDIGGESFKSVIGFSRQLGIGFNILGRKSVFERFKICFNEREKVVEFIKL